MDELRVNALLQELARQRNEALDRCANLSADLAVAVREIDLLKRSAISGSGEK